jgi:hypothetical protein
MKAWIPLALLTVLWSLPLAARTPTRAQKETTLSWIASCRRDGGFAADPRPGTRASLRATSAALRATKYFGGQVTDRQAVAKFVESCYNKVETGFAPAPGGKVDPITTAVGLLAVQELGLRSTELRIKPVIYLCAHVKKFEEMRLAAAAYEALQSKCELADNWIAAIEARRHPDGTYGKGGGIARDTAGSVVTILRLGGKVEHLDQVAKALRETQRPDGAWGKEGAKGSDLETTYRVMRALVMLKAHPANPDNLRRFVTRCRHDNGSYAVQPGQPGTMAGTYFAGIVLHWLDAGK